MDHMVGKFAAFFRNMGIDSEYMIIKDYQQLYHLARVDHE